MASLNRSSAFSRVTSLAEQRPLHDAFRWMHLYSQRLMNWQVELVKIPAPPFGETARSLWIADRFHTAGLTSIHTDSIGNVYGEILREESADSRNESGYRGPVVLLSAHLDTVFPIETPLEPILDGDRLEAPGACDNGAGVIGLLAIAHALVGAGMPLPATLVFVGNVGEEGEGDLRGVRHLYQQSPYLGRIAAHIVLDGGGAETVVTHALGCRRFQVTLRGPGGHSFTDAGAPNPIVVLAQAVAALAQVPLQGYPFEPRATMNVGTIDGGTSVNTIPEVARATFDFRSTDVRPIVRLEVALHRAVEDAVAASNALTTSREKPQNQLTFKIEKIGDRPAAELPADSPLLEALRAVDRHLGLRTDLRLGSTDANIPLSLGIPAVSLGAGGDGGGAHTRGEWYSATNRELGLRRVMLLTLSMLDWAATE